MNTTQHITSKILTKGTREELEGRQYGMLATIEITGSNDKARSTNTSHRPANKPCQSLPQDQAGSSISNEKGWLGLRNRPQSKQAEN